MTVQEDQFTGEDDQSLRHVTAERLVTAVEQLHQFAGIRRGGRVLQLTRGVEGDARLRGVGDHETDLGLVGQCHEGGVLRIGVQGPADHVDALQRVYGLTVLAALQVHVVEAVLTVQHIGHALLDGLHHDDTAVEVGLLVHIPDDPIHECAEEVALAELYHLFRHHALRSELFVKWFHCSVLFWINYRLQRYDFISK